MLEVPPAFTALCVNLGWCEQQSTDQRPSVLVVSMAICSRSFPWSMSELHPMAMNM